jgi:hypothetical protein
MSTEHHDIVLAIDAQGMVHAKAVCTAPPEAQCRWESKCDCEVYYHLAVDEHGPFHVAEGPPPIRDRVELEDWLEAKHRMAYGGECRVVAWINAEDALEVYDGDARELFRQKIETAWNGDCYVWKAA